MAYGNFTCRRIRDGVGEVVGEGCLSLDVGTRALYIGRDRPVSGLKW